MLVHVVRRKKNGLKSQNHMQDFLSKLGIKSCLFLFSSGQASVCGLIAQVLCTSWKKREHDLDHSLVFFGVYASHIKGKKWSPMTPDDTLRSYIEKWSVCTMNWKLFATLLPVICNFRQTVWFFSANSKTHQFVYKKKCNYIMCNYYIIKSPDKGKKSGCLYQITFFI